VVLVLARLDSAKKQEEHFLVIDVVGVRVVAEVVEVGFEGLVLVAGPVFADDVNGLGILGIGSFDGCVNEGDLVVEAVLRDRMVAETCEQRSIPCCAAAGAAVGLAVVVSVVVEIVVVAGEDLAVTEADLVAVAEEALDAAEALDAVEGALDAAEEALHAAEEALDAAEEALDAEEALVVAVALEVVVGPDVDAEEVDFVAGTEEEGLAADTEEYLAADTEEGLAAGFVS
jgi:hypothetical protein